LKTLTITITTQAIPALIGFATTLGGQIIKSLRTFILAVSIDAPAALLALTTSAAVANAALSVGFIGLVAGIVWVANNWSTSCNAMSDAFNTFGNNIRSVARSIDQTMQHLDESIGNTLQKVPGMGGLASAYHNASEQFAEDAVGETLAIHATHSGQITATAKPKSGSGNSSYSTSPSTHQIPGTARAGGGNKGDITTTSVDALSGDVPDKASDIQKKLEEQLKQTTLGEKGLEEAVKLAGSAQAEASAQDALRTKQLEDLKEKHTLLNNAIYTESQMLASDTAKKNEAISSGNQYKNQIDAINAVITKTGKETIDQKNALSDLNEKYNDAKSTLQTMNGQISTLTSNLQKNKDVLLENSNAMNTLKNATLEKIASEKREAESFYAKSQQQMQEDMQTADMTASEKLSYYTAMYAKLESLANQYKANNDERYVEEEKLAEQTYSKELSAYMALQKEQEDAAKKTQDQEEKYVTSFIDTVLVKHQGLKDGIKSILDDLTKMWEQAFTKMITGSQSFQNMAKNLQGIFGGGSDSSANALTNKSSLSPSGTASSPVYVQNVDSSGGNNPAINTSSTNPNGVFGLLKDGSVPVNIVKEADTDLNTSNPAPVNIAAVGGQTASSTQASTNWGQGAGSGIAGILGGAGIGSTAASFFGEQNTGDAQLGGALGGGLSALLGASGPTGMIISAVSGLLGGLFGSHETPAEEPDQSDQAYAQDTENLSGGVADNGTNWTFSGFPGITPSTQYSPYAGNQNLSQQMATYVQNINQASLNTTQEQLLQQMKALNPTDSSTGWQVANEYQGVDTLNSGKQIAVATYDTMLANFQTMMSAENANTPEFSLARISGGATSNLSQISANGLTDVNYYNPNNPVNSTSGASGAINVTITNTGTVVGNNGMSQLAQIVSQELQNNLTNGTSNVRVTL